MDVQGLIDKYGPQVWNNVAAPVWQAAVLKQVVDGVTNIVWAIALSIVAVVCWRACTSVIAWGKLPDNNKNYSSDGSMAVALGYFGKGFTLLAGVIGVGSCLTYAIARFINPQWYAIADLLGTVTGKK